MPKTYEHKGNITYVLTTFGKNILIRMNVETGKTWYYEQGCWLPVTEK